MDFELREEQKDIQKAAREFAQGEFDKEKILRLEETHAYPREIWKKASQLGFIGIHFPEEYGGQGYGVTENTLIVEEFCRQDSGVGIALSLADFSSEVILRFGTPEQKKKYLLPVTQGEFISAGAYTEPDHGSDITLLSTTAKKGDSFLSTEPKPLSPTEPLPIFSSSSASVIRMFFHLIAASAPSSLRKGRRVWRRPRSCPRWASE